MHPARRSLSFEQRRPTTTTTTSNRGSRVRYGHVFSSSEHCEMRARAARRTVRGTEIDFRRRVSGANFFGRALHSVLGRAASFRYHKGALVGSALVSGCRHACDEEACVKWTREQPRHQVRRSSFGGAASSLGPHSGASPTTSPVVMALVHRVKALVHCQGAPLRAAGPRSGLPLRGSGQGGSGRRSRRVLDASSAPARARSRRQRPTP